MVRQWAPFTLAWDDHVPVDISFVFESEKPAGKHGFLRTAGDRMVFEDGTAARFWGTCFNSGASFPSHADSEMVARRLAKFGVNMMRTHQMDAEWASPNIFQFNRAAPKDNTRSLDAESLDRLDYLIYCLKQQGIYIYLDLLTYRKFRPGDAVDAVDELTQGAKPYVYFDLRLIELQKEFNENLWLHLNPYTGLAYKDDAAIALSELANEIDPFLQKPVLEPYRSRLEARYRAWADSRGLPVPEGKVDLAAPTPQVAVFLHSVMEDYYREMIGHLRDIGVKIPINGTNWSINLAVAAAQLASDYSDSHCYWNFPLWEDERGTATAPMVGSYANTYAYLVANRTLDRPFFVSEWDHAWPDEWRAESPVAYAAVAALQGWTGVTIHTYRYGTWKPEDRLGGGGSTINGITYRNHFDSFNDPAKFGLFYHAALLFRRGDVRAAEKSVAVQVADDGGAWLLTKPDAMPALNGLVEQHRVGIDFPGHPTKADILVAPDERLVGPEAGEVCSDTGEMWRSWTRRYGWIDTPRTKAAYGFLGEAGTVQLTGLALNVKTDFATVAISSLTGDPIDRSESLLLSAVGRCDNSGAKYDDEHKRQYDYGHPPVLIEPIEAEISLTTSRAGLKVWLISDKGEAVIRQPATYEDGVLSFAIGPQPRYNPSTMYYLITL
jgi:hypothetical protein